MRNSFSLAAAALCLFGVPGGAGGEDSSPEAATWAAALAPQTTIAVVPFECRDENTQYAALRTGIADMMITDLAQVGVLSVVERIKVQKLLAEMNLAGTSGEPRTGEQLKATRVVGGNFTTTAEETIAISADITGAQGGEAAAIEPVTGRLADFFDLQKKLVFAILDNMEITLTDEERQRIRKIPTENLLALLAYSEGLEASDDGDLVTAKQKFAKAASLDPKFSAATDRLEAMGKESSQDGDKIHEAVPEEAPLDILSGGPSAPPAAPAAPAAPALRPTVFDATSGVALRAATMTQAGFMPELAVPGPQITPAEQSGTAEGSPAAITENAAETTTPYTRPPFADAHDLGLDSKKEIPIIVELPEAR